MPDLEIVEMALIALAGIGVIGFILWCALNSDKSL
jgi:hypothetical protein